MPPKLEMKSSQVILRDLSNSEELEMKIDLCLQLHFPTKGSWTSKEDVHHSNVLLICVVVSLVLGQVKQILTLGDLNHLAIESKLAKP